ncbi:hypothetical protein C7E12_23045, partial [Stenotrophomonas maltophilia]
GLLLVACVLAVVLYPPRSLRAVQGAKARSAVVAIPVIAQACCWWPVCWRWCCTRRAAFARFKARRRDLPWLR